MRTFVKMLLWFMPARVLSSKCTHTHAHEYRL